MRISDWSSDVCSSDLPDRGMRKAGHGWPAAASQAWMPAEPRSMPRSGRRCVRSPRTDRPLESRLSLIWEKNLFFLRLLPGRDDARSEEHTSELQSLMRIPYAVFCLKKTQHTPN